MGRRKRGYVNGAMGGMMSPLGENAKITDPQTGQPAPEKSWRKCELMGQRVADVAVEALKNGEKVVTTSVVTKSQDIFIPLQNERFRLAFAVGVIVPRQIYLNGKPNNEARATNVPGVGKVKMPVGMDLKTEVNLVTLAAAQIVTIPAEIYPELVNGGIPRYPGADFPDAPFEAAVALLQGKSQYSPQRTPSARGAYVGVME